jgi:hypothetical protein
MSLSTDGAEFVRERHAIGLSDAIAKAAFLPASFCRTAFRK